MLFVVLTILRYAPAIAEPSRPPLIRIAVLAVTVATLRAVALVIVACFPFSAVRTLVPCTDSEPDSVVLPVTLSVELSVHAPSACSSFVATTSRPCTSPEAVLTAQKLR